MRITVSVILGMCIVASAVAQEGSQRPEPHEVMPEITPAQVKAAQVREPVEAPPGLAVLIASAQAQEVLMQAELSTTREWRAYQRAAEARAEAIKAHDARVAERLAALQAKANGLPEHRAALALKQRADAEAAAAGLVIDWTTGQIGAKP